MADNALTVLDASGNAKTLKSLDIGGVHIQGAVFQLPETALRSGTASDHRFTVTSATPKFLAAAAGALTGTRFVRVRVFHSVHDPTLPVRCYYVTDGATPTNTGSNAMGYLLHGEQIIVQCADLTDFGMIMETGAAGSFEGYAEYVSWAV